MKQEEGRRCGKNSYWWLKLVAGLLLLAAGVLSFIFPLESYETLTWVFGCVILISGIVQLTVGISDERYYVSKGWAITSGVLDVILGIFFLAWPMMTAITIPWVLAFWMLYSGLTALFFSSQMGKVKPGARVWNIFIGIIMVIFAIGLMIQPLLLGIEVVVLFMGASFVFNGVYLLGQAFTFKSCDSDV